MSLPLPPNVFCHSKGGPLALVPLGVTGTWQPHRHSIPKMVPVKNMTRASKLMGFLVLMFISFLFPCPTHWLRSDASAASHSSQMFASFSNEQFFGYMGPEAAIFGETDDLIASETWSHYTSLFPLIPSLVRVHK